ncbi:uncharacterized protein LOC134237816 [Saccostrea cucullata]|uniref:uncharacterized protein LOC134237816 n=1 Tax=Saccostrea cuccullata TaxID=36930 RepID=UPI002ED46A90
MAVYDDDKIIKIDQLMACAKESFLANIVRSYIFTIKHSMLRCSSTASLEYILENGAPKRFETPGSGFCITTPYQTIQSIFVRCIVVTVLTSESDFYFQFKTKDLKGTFVAGDAVVITGYWLQGCYFQNHIHNILQQEQILFLPKMSQS